MAEWVECKISDIGTVVGGATPSTKKTENYEGGNIAWITPKDLSTFSGRYIQHGERNITEAGLRSCSTQLLPKNTVLFSSRAPIGYVAIAANDVCTNQGFKSVIPNENTNPLFLYYLLKYNKDKIEGMGSGTTFKEVSGNTMKNIVVSVPIDKKVQERISSMLGSIDDKIEENERINNNLEQQMRALFNEFLLVNHFNSLTTVEDAVLTANTGADAIQKAPIVDYDTGVRCIRVGDMTNNRSFHAWGFTKVTDDVFKRYQLHKDDIVVTRTASIGLNTIIAENLSAVYNNGLIRLTVNHSKILPLFLYRQFQTVDFTNYIARIESETSVRPNMKINYLLKYEFVLPPMDKQKELIDLLAPMLNQQNALITESKHLENLRDTLLPKLMSGEIDVSDIEI
jgi:type I restriction modification DNA specificity domain protein (fragment)